MTIKTRLVALTAVSLLCGATQAADIALKVAAVNALPVPGGPQGTIEVDAGDLLTAEVYLSNWSGDLLRGTADEKGEAADGYVSFGGTWAFDGEAILFDIAYSLFPNWIGGQQKRLASFDSGELVLQTTGPILMAGKVHRGAARWLRK